MFFCLFFIIPGLGCSDSHKPPRYCPGRKAFVARPLNQRMHPRIRREGCRGAVGGGTRDIGTGSIERLWNSHAVGIIIHDWWLHDILTFYVLCNFVAVFSILFRCQCFVAIWPWPPRITEGILRYCMSQQKYKHDNILPSIQETSLFGGVHLYQILPKTTRSFSTSILGKLANVLVSWEKMGHEWIIHVGFSSSQHVRFAIVGQPLQAELLPEDEIRWFKRRIRWFMCVVNPCHCPGAWLRSFFSRAFY